MRDDDPYQPSSTSSLLKGVRDPGPLAISCALVASLTAGGATFFMTCWGGSLAIDLTPPGLFRLPLGLLWIILPWYAAFRIAGWCRHRVIRHFSTPEHHTGAPESEQESS